MKPKHLHHGDRMCSQITSWTACDLSLCFDWLFIFCSGAIHGWPSVGLWTPAPWWCHQWEGISLRHNLSAPVRGHSNKSRLESEGVSTGHSQTRAVFVFTGGDSIPPPAAPSWVLNSWGTESYPLPTPQKKKKQNLKGCDLRHRGL